VKDQCPDLNSLPVDRGGPGRGSQLHLRAGPGVPMRQSAAALLGSLWAGLRPAHIDARFEHRQGADGGLH
jgi:hypothetical protein